MPDRYASLSKEDLEAAEHAVRMGDVDYYQDDDKDDLRAMAGIVNGVLVVVAAAVAVALVIAALRAWPS